MREGAAMEAGGKEREALQLLAEAERKVRGASSFLGGLFG